MEIDENHIKARRERTISFVVITVFLIGCAITLGLLIAMIAANIGDADGKTKHLLGRFAWICTVMLGVTLVFLFWHVMRFLRFRMSGGEKFSPTPYVNAWSEAGRRMQVPPEDDEEHEDDSQ